MPQNTIKEISVQELYEMKKRHDEFQLIDVRESDEFDFANIGGELIPLGTLLNNVEKVRKDITVVIHCRSGHRSARAVQELQNRFGYTNLYNLKGGILAWSREIDSSIPQY